MSSDEVYTNLFFNCKHKDYQYPVSTPSGGLAVNCPHCPYIFPHFKVWLLTRQDSPQELFQLGPKRRARVTHDHASPLLHMKQYGGKQRDGKEQGRYKEIRRQLPGSLMTSMGKINDQATLLINQNARAKSTA